LWGDYLEHIFTSREPRRMDIGVSAMTCYLHGCRQQNETKSRKYLAKVLWLLSFDDEEMSLMKTLDKYAVGVPPLHWLPWIPQLLCCLVQYKGNVILNLLNQVGRMYPQAVYFPIRTLYLTLRIEQRERYNSVEQNSAQKGATVGVAKPPQSNGAGGETATSTPQQPTITVTTTTQQTPAAGGSQGATPSGTDPTNPSQPGTTTTAATIKATPTMVKCSKIMFSQRDFHPTVLNSIEGIVDQMVSGWKH
jgi:transformation/transcription domain-associated protein